MKKIKQYRKCLECETEFEIWNALNIYCSPKCQARHFRKQKNVPKICRHCQKTFFGGRQTIIYCSRECRNAATEIYEPGFETLWPAINQTLGKHFLEARQKFQKDFPDLQVKIVRGFIRPAQWGIMGPQHIIPSMAIDIEIPGGCKKDYQRFSLYMISKDVEWIPKEPRHFQLKNWEERFVPVTSKVVKV